MMTKKAKISKSPARGRQGACSVRKRGASPVRSRGGQPGNTNALKHGFYSRSFTEREKKLLSQIPLTAFHGEIDLARVSNRRVIEALRNTPGLTYNDILSGARVISLGNASIASLSRAQFQAARLTADAHETGEWLKKLLADLPPDETDQDPLDSLGEPA